TRAAMPSVAVSRPTERAALLTRAVGAACPVQLVMTALWLLVPHAGRAHEGWVIALTLATTPLYAAVVLRRSIVPSRMAMNVTGLVGILAVSCLVWAGGGLPSGFVLMALWFLPITVCSLPRGDVAAHVALLVAGSGAAAWLSFEHCPHGRGSLWGFAVVAVATLIVNTALVAYLFDRMRATTDDFKRQSAQDSLTGLANRAALHERLDAIDVGSPRAVYVIDVDGFKFVNDSLGHHAGDRLLMLVAKRLAGHARAGDLLGRRLAESCAEPFSLDGEEVEVSVTVGACRVGDAASGEEAMRDADLALYAGKIERRGTVKLFSAPMRD